MTVSPAVTVPAMINFKEKQLGSLKRIPENILAICCVDNLFCVILFMVLSSIIFTDGKCLKLAQLSLNVDSSPNSYYNPSQRWKYCIWMHRRNCTWMDSVEIPKIRCSTHSIRKNNSSWYYLYCSCYWNLSYQVLLLWFSRRSHH